MVTCASECTTPCVKSRDTAGRHSGDLPEACRARAVAKSFFSAITGQLADVFWTSKRATSKSAPDTGTWYYVTTIHKRVSMCAIPHSARASP